MNKHKNILLFTAIIVLLVFFVGCSTKKNTWLSRNYQSFATKYNVKFNAQTQFDDGIKALKTNHKDDYSSLLPMFPTINKETSGAISGQMNTTIEKCRKAIKLHSIRKKPAKRPLGMSSEQYSKFKSREEFNSQIKNAWLLLGKADFYKGDFIGAVGDFNYLTRHFQEATAVVCEAKIWIARAYAEMDWLYESENVLQNLNESTIPNSLSGTFASFKADILLRQKRYKEAIPFLIVAIDKEKDKYYVSRFEFILGQLYQIMGQENLAAQHFTKAKQKAQSYEMIFNASLLALETEKKSSKAVKGLLKMAKSSNNKNYLDQIYFAVGNKYLKNDNESKAIEYYKLAMAKSTRNGLEKALVALKLGDLYYQKQEYILAAPCYDSVVKMMPNEHFEYPRAEKSAEMLGELVQNYNNAQLQDSLLRLSEMTEAEQLKIIDKIIADLIETEKKAAKDSADRVALEVAKSYDNAGGFEPMPGTNTNADWYFYNSLLTGRGKREFDIKWDRRILEDNWRRQNKIIVSQSIEETENAEENTESIENAPITDVHTPAYYLAQIPKTDKQKSDALTQIASALYNMGGIFLIKLQDDNKADEMYRQFQSRFPQDERKCETYYYDYQINGRLGKTDEQGYFRDRILTEFPESKYAAMLRNPDYAQKIAEMFLQQDSIYEHTYKAYSQSNFAVVKHNYNVVLQEFPLSELMPKFTFLNALTVGKTGKKDEFEQSLDDLIKKYPDSDVATMSRDILALMRQGREQSKDKNTGGLVEKRTKETETEIENIHKNFGDFTTKTSEPQNILFVQKNSDKTLINNILYDIAAYSFNKFLIKDFDFDIKKIDKKEVLIVSGIESMDEAKWYKNLLFTDEMFVGKEYLGAFDVLIISDTNLKLLNAGKSLEEYLKFDNSQANR
jgi:tetratricopeptide (TPR) repeat protein